MFVTSRPVTTAIVGLTALLALPGCSAVARGDSCSCPNIPAHSPDPYTGSGDHTSTTPSPAVCPGYTGRDSCYSATNKIVPGPQVAPAESLPPPSSP